MKKFLINSIGCILILISGEANAKPTYNKELDFGNATEYQDIREIVNRLAENNDLGNQPIIFTITPGTYAISVASGMGLCKDESCDYYAQLNPFKNYGRRENEIIRQAYLYGNIEAWGYANGTIDITRQTFRILEDRQNLLGCIISHELAHILNYHSFNKDKELSEQMTGKPEEAKELISAEISRKYESIADAKSQEMMIRAGYPRDTCLQMIDLLHKTTGDGSGTQDIDMHPGHSERMQSLRKYLDAINPTTLKMQEKTTGTWNYNSLGNYLKFTPRKRGTKEHANTKGK